jgi:hypothetical protein
VVQKAKWEAWNSLGKLSKVDAMQHYVDELKKIVETMPHTAQVSEFLHLVGPFYEAVSLQEMSGQKQTDDNTSLSQVQEDTTSGSIPTDSVVTVDSGILTSPIEQSGSGPLDVSGTASNLPQPVNSAGIANDSSSDSEMFEDSIGPEDVHVAVNQLSKTEEDQVRDEMDHQLDSHSEKPLIETAETMTLPNSDQNISNHHSQVIDALEQLQAAVTAISQQLHTIQTSLSTLSIQVQSHVGSRSSEQSQIQRRILRLVSWVLQFCRTRVARIGVGVLLILFLFTVLPISAMQK